MNRYLLLSFFLLIAAASCKEEEPPIPPQKMTKILTDLHLAESHAQLIPIDKGGYMVKNTDTLLWMYGQLYKKYNIDSTSLKKAILWYELHPEQFDKVYENILTALSISKVAGLDSTAIKTDSISELLNRDSLKSNFIKARSSRTDTL